MTLINGPVIVIARSRGVCEKCLMIIVLRHALNGGGRGRRRRTERRGSDGDGRDPVRPYSCAMRRDVLVCGGGWRNRRRGRQLLQRVRTTPASS